ncbi:MAG: undecaprenyl-diphosphate phosphatase [Arenicellales bacterium]|nr:undecaprenyl-diphosphate phosphatase [Arenicellales bacterium]
MDFLQAVVLALLQGITEFLPISSSAHLILLPKLLGWPDQGLSFDVAVHVGTLVAVCLYFKSDIRHLTSAWYFSVFKGSQTQESKLAWAVIVATLPAVIFGFLANEWFIEQLRDPLLIAAMTIGFGLLLWWADRSGSRVNEEYALTLAQALLIGCAQAIALIPGTSRSGVTITAGLALGLTRKAAARFSFLLSIPIILAAGIVKLLDLIRQPEQAWWLVLGSATLVSAVAAYLCIHYFLALVERIGLTPFVIYRVLLGLFLFYVFM